MFPEALHERLDGEEEREIRVHVLLSFHRDLERLIKSREWEPEQGIRHLLAAGYRAVVGWRTTDRSLDDMTDDEKIRYLQDRAASLDAAFATLKFQSHQVMRQNDALQMNMRGLMPQLEAARERVIALEEELRHLRSVVPPEQHGENYLVPEETPEPDPAIEEDPTFGSRLRGLFGGR
jgi:chromosome segregation ATPase